MLLLQDSLNFQNGLNRLPLLMLSYLHRIIKLENLSCPLDLINDNRPLEIVLIPGGLCEFYPFHLPRRAMTQVANARESLGCGFFYFSVLPSSLGLNF